MNGQRRIDGKDLYIFPKYVPKIEEKEREYEKGKSNRRFPSFIDQISFFFI